MKPWLARFAAIVADSRSRNGEARRSPDQALLFFLGVVVMGMRLLCVSGGVHLYQIWDTVAPSKIRNRVKDPDPRLLADGRHTFGMQVDMR
ncbi:MAG: hypothetical protein M3N50_12835 [Pseudomonadota bacterium]|nr:hypothetical protein [Pseudomonadota bacterium]